jgi:CheY-like chemotaxis protein
MEAISLLTRAARDAMPYDLAIIDYQMPQMDGLTLAGRIKADRLLKNVRVVMLTSLGNKLSEEMLARFGISESLQKPVRQLELYKVLTRVLNRTSQAQATVATINTPEISARLAKARVLIAEDNIVNQKVALRQLQKLGLYADAVSNGREVLEAMDRIGYDVILMDCQMPLLDGYETTQAIRRHAQFSETYIIAMTANAMQGDREKCLESGMDDYIPKPIRMQDLEAALAKVFAEENANIMG